VIDIGGNDDITSRNTGADKFRVQDVLFRDDFHLRGDNTFFVPVRVVS